MGGNYTTEIVRIGNYPVRIARVGKLFRGSYLGGTVLVKTIRGVFSDYHAVGYILR